MSYELVKPGRDLNNFRKMFTSMVLSIDFDTNGDQPSFYSRYEGIRLGKMDLFRYHWQGRRRASRNIQNIQANPVDEFLIFLPQNAPVEMFQLGNETVVEPGNFVFLSTQKPFEALCTRPPSEVHSELVMKIPGPVLRQHIPHLDQCCAMSVSTRQGAGLVMQQLISSILTEGRFLSDRQARMLGAMLVNAIDIATMDTPELRERDVSPPSFHAHERVRAKAQDFIECNLSNPLLDCAMIAKYCRVSLRHLHASFESSSTSVGAFIRATRLQLCKNDLLNPALRHQSITQIAMKWGYSSSANFTRAYRERFGKTPSEERQSLRLV